MERSVIRGNYAGITNEMIEWWIAAQTARLHPPYTVVVLPSRYAVTVLPARRVDGAKRTPRQLFRNHERVIEWWIPAQTARLHLPYAVVVLPSR